MVGGLEASLLTLCRGIGLHASAELQQDEFIVAGLQQRPRKVQRVGRALLGPVVALHRFSSCDNAASALQKCLSVVFQSCQDRDAVVKGANPKHNFDAKTAKYSSAKKLHSPICCAPALILILRQQKKAKQLCECQEPFSFPDPRAVEHLLD